MPPATVRLDPLLAKEQLPPGAEPKLGPISTGLGEVFQYTLASDSHSLTELRTMQDWLIAPRLRMISREGNMRRVVVEASIRGRDLGGFVTEVQDKLDTITRGLPPGYWIDYGGTFENQKRANKRLVIVVPLSVLLILFMLIYALKSAKAAGIVLANLPFALVGGVLAMLLFRITLNVPSTVGFIALFGVAVQNGTVLVTFISQLRQAGQPLREAVIQACALRFRAMVATAATTVLGLLPMVYAVGPGAEVQRPLAVVVIGGLVTATALTLFVLPSLYHWLAPRLVPSAGDLGAAAAQPDLHRADEAEARART